MPRSATPATRNEATRRLKPPKSTPSAELTIGTAIWSSHERLRTVADGCRRLRTVANSCELTRNVKRTLSQPPDPQSETGTLATHSGKIIRYVSIFLAVATKALDILEIDWRMIQGYLCKYNPFPLVLNAPQKQWFSMVK